jgi:prephenate dehydrogenase
MARRVPLVGEPGGDPPPFERIGIVGLGLLGGSLALATRRRWPASLVVGVDRNDVLERATLRHATDVSADDLGMLRECDLIVLAAPVRTNARLLGELAAYVPGRAVVTDVGSTKRETVAAARSLPQRLSFVGGHPLAGAARAGIEHASADLFAGRPWLLTPGDDTDAASLDRLRGFVADLGAHPHLVGPDAHDRLMAYLSHLPQLAASAMMHVIGHAIGTGGLALAGRGLADTTRLASSPAGVWADICASSPDEIGPALDALIVVLRELRDGLTDRDAVARVFESAAAWRAQVPPAGTPRR